MKSGIIIYRSKYGATKKYADWLAEMTGFECMQTPKANADAVTSYNTIILCGGVYASGIAGLSFLKRNIGVLKGRRIAVLCVGASPYDEKALNEIKAHNMKDELRDIPLFYGRGAWNEERMTFKDRTLCRLLQRSIANKSPDTLEPWMKALMDAAGKSCDWTDKKYLAPILEFI